MSKVKEERIESRKRWKRERERERGIMYCIIKNSLFHFLRGPTGVWRGPSLQTFKSFQPLRFHCLSGGSRHFSIWIFTSRPSTSCWLIFTSNGCCITSRYLPTFHTGGRHFRFGNRSKKLSLWEYIDRCKASTLKLWEASIYPKWNITGNLWQS